MIADASLPPNQRTMSYRKQMELNSTLLWISTGMHGFLRSSGPGGKGNHAIHVQCIRGIRFKNLPSSQDSVLGIWRCPGWVILGSAAFGGSLLFWDLYQFTRGKWSYEPEGPRKFCVFMLCTRGKIVHNSDPIPNSKKHTGFTRFWF